MSIHVALRHTSRSAFRSPVNESRRLARFSKLAHTPGPLTAGKPQRSREFPYTLDLRTE